MQQGRDVQHVGADLVGIEKLRPARRHHIALELTLAGDQGNLHEVGAVDAQAVGAAVDHVVVLHLQVGIEKAVELAGQQLEVQGTVVVVVARPGTLRIELGADGVVLAIGKLVALIVLPVHQGAVIQGQRIEHRVDVEIVAFAGDAVAAFVKQLGPLVQCRGQRPCGAQHSLLLAAAQVVFHLKDVLVAKPGNHQQEAGQEHQLEADSEWILEITGHGQSMLPEVFWGFQRYPMP